MKTSGPPCEHMESMLNDAAESSAKGPRLWFTLLHCLHCGRCRRYLDALRGMVARLRRDARVDEDTDALTRLENRIGDAAQHVP